MSYKIAIASFDDELSMKLLVLQKVFLIYEVINGVYKKAEERICVAEETVSKNNCNSDGCGNTGNCGSGCGGQGEASSKVELISDCRAVVCKKDRFSYSEATRAKSYSSV